MDLEFWLATLVCFYFLTAAYFWRVLNWCIASLGRSVLLCMNCGLFTQLVAFLRILRDEMYYINLNCFYCYALRVNISQVIWNLLALGRQVFFGVIPVFHVEALLKHVAQKALSWCSLPDAAKLAATLVSYRKKESWGGRRQVSWACFTTFPPAITLLAISTAPCVVADRVEAPNGENMNWEHANN